MSKVAILTDSNSDLSQKEAKELGVFVMPMPFFIDGNIFFEDISLSQEEFYKKLDEPDAKISTSMPAIGDLQDKWSELLKSYDQVVYIPMSSGLSSSCSAAKTAAMDDDFEGRVFVADNHRISVTLKLSVFEAKRLADQGKDGEYIRNFLEETAYDSKIYITVGTLKYLKKGGRLTPAVANIGSLLRIKPVLKIDGEKLDLLTLARTMPQAKAKMVRALRDNMSDLFHDPEGKDCIICVAHTQEKEMAEEFREELEKEFPGHEIFIDPLSLSVSCHIGPGSLACTVTRKHEGIDIEDLISKESRRK
jgi:DegV family protein with EDD domain